MHSNWLGPCWASYTTFLVNKCTGCDTNFPINGTCFAYTCTLVTKKFLSIPPSHHYTNTESREAPSLDLHRMDNVQAAQLPPNNENFQRETTESREASSLELRRTDNVRQANCPWNLKIFKAKLERAEKPFSLVIGRLNFLLLLFHIAAHTVLFAEATAQRKMSTFLVY